MSLSHFKRAPFSRGDAAAALLIAVLAIYVRHISRYVNATHRIVFTVDEQRQIDIAFQSYIKADTATDYSPVQSFPFEPNSISVDSLRLLGLPDYMAIRWVKLRSSGFTFRQKEDVLKIYGLDSAWYEKNVQNIRIRKKHDAPIRINSPGKRAIVRLDINTADTAAWKTIPGIGSVFAQRICKYRELLGGFASVAQLNEVFGVSPQLYEQMLKYLDTSVVLKPQVLRLDTLSESHLAKHPYVSFRQSKAILNYVKTHGLKKLTSSDLQKMIFLDSTTRVRIKPYVIDQGL